MYYGIRLIYIILSQLPRTLLDPLRLRSTRKIHKILEPGDIVLITVTEIQEWQERTQNVISMGEFEARFYPPLAYELITTKIASTLAYALVICI